MILEWPRAWYRVTGGSFPLVTVSLGTSSMFTSRRNKSVNYQAWRANLEFAPEVGPDEYQEIDAFFARLEGDVGLIRIGDQARLMPRYNRQHPQAPETWSDGTLWSDGSAWASDLIPPTVQLAASAARGANFIHLKGLPASIPRAITPGDLFEIRPAGVPTETSNLYSAVVGGKTDANGEIGFEIRPRLRQSFAENDMVVTFYPQAVMQLTDGEQGIVERAGFTGQFGFSAIEHVP